jgi:CheY-like chemotaxis protein
MTMQTLEILVVEDNQDFLYLVCDALTVLGHGAYGVTNAEDAIGHLKSGKFNVLLADIHLPGMSGIELAEMAVNSTPGIKIIFASGYGYLVADKTDFDFTLISKPYGLARLKEVMDGMCASLASASEL